MSTKGPKRKSSIFVDGKSWTNVVLNFRGEQSDRFTAYGGAYHRAGNTLYKKHFKPRTTHDLDVLPIAFLFRHAAELYLKAIVRRGNVMLSMRGKEPVRFKLASHRLTPLIDVTPPIFECAGWSWDTKRDGFRSFEDFRQCVADLEQDPELGIDDSNADIWRYPVRRDGETPQFPRHFTFNVEEFVRRMDGLLQLLGGAAIGLDYLIDDIAEAAMYDAEYGQQSQEPDPGDLE